LVKHYKYIIMKYFRRWYWLIFLVLFFVNCHTAQHPGKSGDMSARTALKSVKKHFQSIKQLELTAKMDETLKAGPVHRSMHFSMNYAIDKPGKIRYEMKHSQDRMLHISNGNTTWSYISNTNEYTKKKASMIQTPGGSSSPKARNIKKDIKTQFAKIFNPLADSVEKITSLGMDTLTMPDDTKRMALKIQVKYHRNYKDIKKNLAKNPMIKRVKFSPTTYWIDTKKRVILRKSDQVEPVFQKNRGMTEKIQQNLFFTSYNLHPDFNDTTFNFTPPSGARQVKKLQVSQTQNQPNSSSQTGKKAINFTLKSYKGKTVQLSNLKGKVVVLDFWATWCGPCREELPHVQQLYKKMKDKGVVILGINSQNKKKVKSFLKRNNYTFTNLYDANQSVTAKYHVNAIPSVFVINRQGKVSAHLLGYHTEAMLRKAIKKAGL